MHIIFQPSELSLTSLAHVLILCLGHGTLWRFCLKKFQLLSGLLWQSQGTIIHHLEETDKKFNSDHQKMPFLFRNGAKKMKTHLWRTKKSHNRFSKIKGTSGHFGWLWTLIEDLEDFLFFGKGWGKKVYCIWQTIETVKLKVVAI